MIFSRIVKSILKILVIFLILSSVLILFLFVGKPRPEDLEKTRDEELPDVVAPDFKTTVDDLEWRG